MLAKCCHDGYSKILRVSLKYKHLPYQGLFSIDKIKDLMHLLVTQVMKRSCEAKRDF